MQLNRVGIIRHYTNHDLTGFSVSKDVSSFPFLSFYAVNRIIAELFSQKLNYLYIPTLVVVI